MLAWECDIDTYVRIMTWKDGTGGCYFLDIQQPDLLLGKPVRIVDEVGLWVCGSQVGAVVICPVCEVEVAHVSQGQTDPTTGFVYHHRCFQDRDTEE